MEIGLLRAFLAVAREGNLTRAADHLKLSQPAVSLQIKTLQQMLQLKLFTRTPHGLRLTQEGLAMLPHAERAVAAAGDVTRAARAIRNEVRGALRIGTIIDPPFLRLGGFLKSLVEEHPHVATELRHGISGWVGNQIQAGNIDVGYYVDSPDLPADPALHEIRLTQYQYLVVAPPGWSEIVARAAPDRHWRSLAKLPWIGTPPESVHNRLLSRIFEPLACRPVTVAEVDQEVSILELVKSGVGLALARDSLAISESHLHGVTIIEGVNVAAALTFRCLAKRRDEPVIAATFRIIERQWAR